MKKIALALFCVVAAMAVGAQNHLRQIVSTGEIIVKNDCKDLSYTATDSAMPYHEYFAEAVAKPGVKIPVYYSSVYFYSSGETFIRMRGVWHMETAISHDQGICYDGANIDVTGPFQTGERELFAWPVLLALLSVVSFSCFILLDKNGKGAFLIETIFMVVSTVTLIIIIFTPVIGMSARIFSMFALLAFVASAFDWVEYLSKVLNVAYYLLMAAFFFSMYTA